MSRKYKFHNPEGMYFVSFAVVYWIDVFIRNVYKDILLDNLKQRIAGDRLELHAWCIMTSHVHLIFSDKDKNPAKLLGNMKAASALQLKKAIRDEPAESRREWMLWMMERAGKKNSNNLQFQFWQQHNKPVELFTFAVLKQKLDYIHNNPVVSGFVSVPEDYLYSSARDYAGEQELL